MIPIAIVTAETRGEYLAQTLAGLRASDIPETLPVHIFVDKAPDGTKPGGFPALDETWYSVHRSECNILSWANHGRAFLDTMHMHPDAPACIVIEDDLLFKPDWYTRMGAAFNDRQALGLTDKDQLALLSGYVGITQGSYPEAPGLYPKDSHRTVGAVCWLLTRFMWEFGHLFFEKMPPGYRSAYDTRVQTFIAMTEIDFRVLRPGCVQHIGTVSICHPKATGRPNRIDPTVKAPYAGGFHEPDISR